MSNLHKRIKSHEHMSLEQKQACKCEQCRCLNVNKRYRKIETPETTSVESSLELPRKRVIRKTHSINNTLVPQGLSDIKI